MSTIYEKLALLPERIPIKFQYGAGPTVTGTLILTNPYLKCLQIESGGKVRNIEHFINSYALHNDVKYLHFVANKKTTVLLSFVVASGERADKSFQTLLVDKPIPNDWLPFVGIVEPAIAKVKGMLDQAHAEKDKNITASIVIEMMRYLLTALPFIKRNPPFHNTVIAKCEQLRSEHHGEFPEVVTACTDLLVALGQTPATLISGDEFIRKQWTSRLPEGIVMGLQISTGPRILGIVYPHENKVLSTFYRYPVPLQQWVSKYAKTYGLGKRTCSVIEIIRLLWIGDMPLYTMLEHWKPTYSSLVRQATDMDMAQMRGEEVDVSGAGPCDCAGCTDEEAPSEETPAEDSCDCRPCGQDKRLDELFHRTDRLFCAFLADDEAVSCDCVRCCYEEGLNKRIRELESQMNTVLKRLDEKKEDDE